MCIRDSFGSQFVFEHILLFLLSNIFLDGCLVQSNGTHLIPRCPKVPVPELVLQIPVFLKNHHRCFSFEIPHEAGDAIFWRYRQQQVYMVGHHMPFQYLYTFPFAQVPDILLYIRT